MNKTIILIATAALLSLSAGSQLFAAETNAPAGPASASTNASPASSESDLIALVTRINGKLKQENLTEADLATELKEFDTLFTRHTEATPADRAHILAMKAQLYLQVLGNPEKALEIFKRIKNEFPTLQLNGNTDQIITTLEAMVEKKKVTAALVPGAKFPDFDEKDLEGNSLSVGKYKGKVVLVDFWATWCMPCVMDLPQVLKVYEKYHDKGFEIVGVSLDEDKGKLEQFVKQRKMAWPQFFDGQRWNNKLAVKYGVESTPSGYLIDRDGKIIMKLAHADELEAAVGKALEN